MKNITKIFLNIFIFLLGMLNAVATPHPPAPGQRKPPPPPGLPIDQWVWPVVILALVYGIYIIYNYQIKAKTPI